MSKWHHKHQRGGTLTFRGVTCVVGDDGLLDPQPKSKDLKQLRWLHAYPHTELRGASAKPEDLPEADAEADAAAAAKKARAAKAAATRKANKAKAKAEAEARASQEHTA